MADRTYQDARAQWFQDDYPGAVMDPDAGVLHTTEGTSWPTYSGGATAPNVTAKPDFRQRRLEFRTHFPLDRSSRALKNLAGGVETNTAQVVQVELVGTCDRRTSRRWAQEGREHIYWPEAPDWALNDLAKFLAFCKREHGIPVSSPVSGRWTPYPESYGPGGQRLSAKAWRNLVGWVGHQHVPENTHGDPGALDWPTLQRKARALLEPVLPVVRMRRLRKAYERPLAAPVAVYRVQKALRAHGHLDGFRKGRYGTSTRDAVKSYQRSIGHPRTGRLTRPEATRLGRGRYRVE